LGSGLALGAALLSAPALAQDGSLSDGGSLQQELAELERTRQQFDTLAKQLDEQRAVLERQTDAARAGQNRIFVVAAVVILVLVSGGVVWVARERRRRDRS
jgi:hypothetical protein